MAPGGVDRHGRRDLVHREVGHEEAHVGQRVDGHADLADLALGPGVVGVVAHLGREVEGARETRLTGVEEELEALVGRLGRAEAGVLAHGPELRAVHLAVDARGCRGTTPAHPAARPGPSLRGRRRGRRVGWRDPSRCVRSGLPWGSCFSGVTAPRLRRFGGGPRATRGRLRRWTTPQDRPSPTSASA